MRVRKVFLPRSLSDIGTTLFLTVAVPITYWFELFIVLPEFMATHSIFYLFNVVLGTFILFNIGSNMVAVMMCNTSILGERITRPANANPKLWKLCAVCEAITPPRSWHCNTCNVCILKRDHHCMFTGCCIGHHNHRYFMWLTFYLFVGTMYSSLFNHFFIWSVHGEHFRNSWTFLKLIFPLAMFAMDASTGQYYLLIYLVNMVGGLFAGLLLFYHAKNMMRGRLTHEKSKQYDYGRMENVRIVLGERWYLTWVSPFLESPLPHGGIEWNGAGVDARRGVDRTKHS